MIKFSTKKPLTTLSIIISAILAAAAAFFGFSRDFLMFLLSIPVMGSLLILALVFLVGAVVIEKSSHGIKASVLLILFAPIAFYTTLHLRDRILFIAWAISHPSEFQTASSKDSIITNWDSWGFAGTEFDSYLISDKFDESSTVASAERWRTRMGLPCPIADTTRMKTGIYIVTTDECPLDAPAFPNK